MVTVQLSRVRLTAQCPAVNVCVSVRIMGPSLGMRLLRVGMAIVLHAPRTVPRVIRLVSALRVTRRIIFSLVAVLHARRTAPRVIRLVSALFVTWGIVLPVVAVVSFHARVPLREHRAAFVTLASAGFLVGIPPRRIGLAHVQLFPALRTVLPLVLGSATATRDTVEYSLGMLLQRIMMVYAQVSRVRRMRAQCWVRVRVSVRVTRIFLEQSLGILLHRILTAPVVRLTQLLLFLVVVVSVPRNRSYYVQFHL